GPSTSLCTTNIPNIRSIIIIIIINQESAVTLLALLAYRTHFTAELWHAQGRGKGSKRDFQRSGQGAEIRNAPATVIEVSPVRKGALAAVCVRPGRKDLVGDG